MTNVDTFEIHHTSGAEKADKQIPLRYKSKDESKKSWAMSPCN